MLNAEQVQQLRVMMMHAGWKEVFHPWMVESGNALIRQLLESPSQRIKPYQDLPDDVIRGEIKRIEYILTWTANQLKVQDHNRVVDELHDARENGSPPVEIAPANP